MKKLNENKLEYIQGGDFWSGLACGIGIGLILTGAGTPLGIIATAAGCGSTIFN